MMPAILAVLSVVVFGGAPSSGQAVAPSGHLAAFAPFVGHDWIATLPGNVTDTQHFEWTFDRQFVRNVHRVRTSDGVVVYEGETIYAWDARAGRIVWWYWNTTGGYVSGTLTVNPDGSMLAEGENHGAVDQLDRTRTLMRVSGDQWHVTVSQQKDGRWVDQPARVYRPVG